MSVTLFDLIVVGVVLFSAFLSMVRGFSREVLSLVAWGLSALIAYLGYPLLAPLLQDALGDQRLAFAGAFAIIFLIVLVVLSLITTRIADFIIDSRIGVLDRSLGFVFGVLRGILIIVVAVAFWNWMVGDAQSPDWIKNAKSKPIFDLLAMRLESLLPGGDNIEAAIIPQTQSLLAVVGSKTVVTIPPHIHMPT